MGQCPLNIFQHPYVKRDLPDIVDLAGAGVALVVGAYKVVLVIAFISLTGAIVQLCPATLF